MRRKYILAACLAAAILVMSSCGSASSPAASTATASQQASESGQLLDTQPAPSPAQRLQPIPAPVEPVIATSTAAFKGSGSVSYEGNTDRLSAEQETLLTDYMNTYYTSLSLLVLRDSSHLFAEDAKDQVDNDRAVLTALIGIRGAQLVDLTLSGYSFKLTVQTVTKEDSGDIRVRVQEENIQNFTAYPGVDSTGYNIGHTFLMTDTGKGWRIKEHRQMGSLYRLVMGQGRWQPGVSTAVSAGPVDVAANVDKLLANARVAVARRKTQGKADSGIRFDNAYDRTAAAGYAREWADRRNQDWQNYDRMGGNCQNFTSQAILAGGIPMDYTAPGQWKWYSDTPNSGFGAAGRSPAWSGVSEFLSYVQSNSGYGLVALADAPYYSGEVGDIIHMATEGDWRHTVIITEVLKDDNGKTVDYLIASNTVNLRDFPVSAYYYTDQMLIKIYGWNN